jgi:hypothetical protein
MSFDNPSSSQQLTHDIAELRRLLDGRGWQIISGMLKDDIMAAAMALGDNPVMPESEMHFRRGAIYASKAFDSVPAMLIARLEGELLVQSHPHATSGNLSQL